MSITDLNVCECLCVTVCACEDRVQTCTYNVHNLCIICIESDIQRNG